MYRLKKEPKEKQSNVTRRSFIAIALVVLGFAIGFLLGGGNSESSVVTTPPVNQPPQVVIVDKQPEEPKLTEDQKGSSIFYDGTYHYNDNTRGAYIFKVVDKESHTICYTAENKYYGNSLAISCIKDDSVEDKKEKKEESKDKHD